MKSVIYECNLCGKKSKKYMEVFMQEFGNINIKLKTAPAYHDHIYESEICFSCADRISNAIKKEINLLREQTHE